MSGSTRRRPDLLAIPFDFSRAAVHAMRVAREQGGPDASLMAVHALSPPSRANPGPAWDETLRARAIAQMRERMTREFDEIGIKAEPHVVVGAAPQALLEWVRSHRPDMIVAPASGKGRLDRLWMGSVTETLVRQAPCPVLVLPPDDATR
jgi:nucleotide-binding universal stress UspA family protein